MILHAKKMIFILFLVVVTGCGLKEGTVQKDKISFLNFTGNTNNAEVFIDELPAFIIDEQSTEDDPVHYQLSPGKHEIIIKKQGQVILHRQVLLGNGLTKEIRVP